MISRELNETRDQASAQSLLGREVPAAVGATSDLFRIHVRALDQLSEPSLFQAQAPPGDRSSRKRPWCVLSFEAVALLRNKGYRARRLEDGFPEWKMAGLPVS